MRVSEYYIIYQEDPADLSVEVNKMILEGWQPTGNLTVRRDDVEECLIYILQMVRREGEAAR